MKFTEFELDSNLLEGIDAMGFEETTPIQEKSIPPILEGNDIIATAQTGTGKTAAFLLPLIHRIINAPSCEKIKAMVIVPTRELAVQISQHLEGISYFTPISSIPVYGGGDGMLFAREKEALTQGVDVVVGTPGRIIAHLNMDYVDLSGLQVFVLDEADRMLDMGFNDDIMKIISHLPPKRQSLLFSATMPPKIRELAKKMCQNPTEINIAISKPAEKIKQYAFVVYENQKIGLVTHLLKEKNFRSVVIFCSTKSNVKDLTRALKKEKLSVDEIHSDLDQKKREEVLLGFKNRNTSILVATDILSRGIDIEDIDMVVNYDVPNDGEDYIHRIGRTARAESDGIAYTLINEKEQRNFSFIERLLEKEVEKAKVPEEFGETPEYKPLTKPFNKKGKKKWSKGKNKHNGEQNKHKNNARAKQHHKNKKFKPGKKEAGNNKDLNNSNKEDK